MTLNMLQKGKGLQISFFFLCAMYVCTNGSENTENVSMYLVCSAWS